VWRAHELAVFLTIALVVTALVATGHRRLWGIPIALVYLGGWANLILIALEPGPFFAPGGERVFLSMMVEDLFNGNIFAARPWIGTPVELALLVAVPMALVRAARRPIRPSFDRYDVCALAAVLVAVAMLAYLWDVFAPYGGAAWSNAHTYLLLGILGAGIGTAKGWWPWLHVLSGLVIGEGVLQVVGSASQGLLADPFSVRTLTLVFTPVVAALWRPLAGWLRNGSSQAALASLVILNLLNLADSVLTELAVGAGQAEELNPLVRAAGWPVKIGVVGVASWLLYRYRPRVLVWPALALGAVLLWHLVGLAVRV
jgi:hypothetical protein